MSADPSVCNQSNCNLMIHRRARNDAAEAASDDSEFHNARSKLRTVFKPCPSSAQHFCFKINVFGINMWCMPSILVKAFSLLTKRWIS